MSSKFYRFRKLPVVEKKLFAEALFFIYSAKIFLTVLPFRFAIRLAAKELENEISPDQKLLDSLKQTLIRSQYLIFWKNACLVQSVAAKWMLNRRNIKSTLFFGFNFNADKKLIAHAWVKVSDIEVVAKGGEYAELHTI